MPRMPPWPGGKGMPLPFGGGKAPMMSKGAAQLTMSRGGTMSQAQSANLKDLKTG